MSSLLRLVAIDGAVAGGLGGFGVPSAPQGSAIARTRTPRAVDSMRAAKAACPSDPRNFSVSF